MRTPLTYYGGKQKLAPQIVAMMPAHRVYLEPFAGGAAVFFAKPRAERETLNDLDTYIVRFWRALRDHADELVRAIELTPYSRTEWEHIRGGGSWRRPNTIDWDGLDDVEAARRLLVSIDQSFSRSRHGWSPPSILFDRRGRWQPGTWENLPEKLWDAVARLRGTCLECSDALELIPRFDIDGCVIYCDPPYSFDTRLAPDKMYGHDDMDGTLWPQLVELLRSLHRAAIIVSGYPNEHTEGLASSGWREVALTAVRNIQARNGDVLPPAPEHVWLSPNIAQRSEALFDFGEMGNADYELRM